MKRASRHANGSIVYDKRRRSWNLYTYDADGKRRSKLIVYKRDLRTKTAAKLATAKMQTKPTPKENGAPTVSDLVKAYLDEKAPTRKDTRRSYQVWFRIHVLPKWGERPINDLQPRPVELWIESLPLAPKSRTHVRGVLSVLWEYAMWRGDVPTERNPMSLVSVKGGSREQRSRGA